ncbi:MAG: formylglycine-generating enzyme family protein [Candidatus Sumerlaeota bacterium]|nr:formylglycine-generating enzyme family protein [Candidatus Sumerlaeota bacterium]
MTSFTRLAVVTGAAVICLGGPGAVAISPAGPVVSNGRAMQRPDGSGKVDVFYDLSGATNMTRVAVVFSSNGGVDYTIIPKTQWLSGDAGPVTAGGLNKQIVWDAGEDLPGVRYEQARAKVIALDSSEFVLLPGGVPLEMVAVPPGSFQMGANDNDIGWSNWDEFPAHMVTIGYGFQLGKFEVTQRQWVALMGSNPASGYGVGDNYPVYYVSWNDIRNTNGFLDKLNQHITATGQGPASFRLPGESEWEYACRAGSQTRFSFGNSDCVADSCDACNLGDYAWYCGNNTPYGTKPVGGKLPNAHIAVCTRL